MALRAILNQGFNNKSKERKASTEPYQTTTTRDRSKENTVRVRKVLIGSLVKTPSAENKSAFYQNNTTVGSNIQSNGKKSRVSTARR